MAYEEPKTHESILSRTIAYAGTVALLGFEIAAGASSISMLRNTFHAKSTDR